MVKHDFKVQTKWRGGREEVGTVNGDIISVTNLMHRLVISSHWQR